MPTRLAVLFFGVSLAFAFPLAAQRSLYWEAIEVDAELDAAGALHVRETQHYVFDGDWNGGERIFNLRGSQQVSMRSISRLDRSTGAMVPLSPGSLDQVDGWSQTDERTFRWRSRMPDDPPFRNERITYVLDYVMTNVLVRKGDELLLDHDFAFPDRSGVIERFVADVRIDPSWQPGQSPVHLERASLQPGDSAVVTVTLRGTGEGASIPPDTRWLRYPLAAVALGFPLLLYPLFLARERRLGRLAPLPDVDRSWIEKNLLPVRAEVIGASWDESVGKAEVGAMLARFVAEKKISTSVAPAKSKFGQAEMTMKLLVPRETFEGYERELVDKFFYEGRTQVTTRQLRDHYKSSGLNPSQVIDKGVQEQREGVMPGGKERGGLSCLLAVALFVLAAVAVFGAGIMAESGREGWIVALGFGGVFFFMFALGAGDQWSKHLDRGVPATLTFMIPILLAACIAAALTIFEVVQYAGMIAAMLVSVAVTWGGISRASSRRGPDAIAYRKLLTAAREYFERELGKPQPALEDEWFPYVLAFGLDRQAEKWFEAFSGTSSSRGSSTFSSSSFGSSGSSGWSGGGGSFGGAGASATWVAAAGSVAAGVSSASSSSSGGGGGGGGGGSSGGGGGGGW